MQAYAPAEGLREGLMAEAHAERRHPRLGHPPHELERDAGLVRGARPGRDDAALVVALQELPHGGAVVAHGVDLGAQLAQVLDEVVRERVVVVEDQAPHGQSAWSQASSMARIAAVDFATDSSYSYAGWASATVPPPAWMCATPSLTTTVR